MMEKKANALLHLDRLKSVCMSVDKVKGVPVFGQRLMCQQTTEHLSSLV